MPLYAASIFLLLVAASLPVAAQAVIPKEINTIVDVEIGMSADTVMAALTKKGYGLEDAFKTGTGDTRWEVSLQDKQVGSFTVVKGQVKRVEVSVYTGRNSIDFGEALYWMFYDNGETFPSTDRDLKERQLRMCTSSLGNKTRERPVLDRGEPYS